MSYSDPEAIRIGDPCSVDNQEYGKVLKIFDGDGDEMEAVTVNSLSRLSTLVLEFEDKYITVDFWALAAQMRPVQ